MCATHGELVHEDDDHAHEGEQHGGEQRAEGEHAAAVEEFDAVDDEHDHCDGYTDDATPCVVAPAPQTASVSWALVSWQPSLVVRSQQRLFLLAPKTSPPVTS